MRRKCEARTAGGGADVFLVRAAYKIADGWEELDRRLTAAAARRAGQTTVTTGAGVSVREMVWACAEFDQALELKTRLARVPGACVTFREA